MYLHLQPGHYITGMSRRGLGEEGGDGAGSGSDGGTGAGDGTGEGDGGASAAGVSDGGGGDAGAVSAPDAVSFDAALAEAQAAAIAEGDPSLANITGNVQGAISAPNAGQSNSWLANLFKTGFNMAVASVAGPFGVAVASPATNAAADALADALTGSGSGSGIGPGTGEGDGPSEGPAPLPAPQPVPVAAPMPAPIYVTVQAPPAQTGWLAPSARYIEAQPPAAPETSGGGVALAALALLGLLAS